MAEKAMTTRTGRTQVCIESAFGTASSWEDVYPASPSEFTRTREEIKLANERPTKFAHQRSVKGPMAWSGKLPFEVRAAVEALDASATPATPPNLLLLKGLLGGEAKAAGSTVASATTTTITVASGHGSRFPKGTIGAVVISGAVVPFLVVDNDGSDELTVYPTLPGSPSMGAVVLNSYCYYPTQSNTQSVGVRMAKINHAAPSDYDQQWTHLGGTGNVSLTLEAGKPAMLEYELAGKPWSGPSSAPSLLPAPAAEETQGAPFVVHNSLTLWQALATTTRVHCPFRKLSLKFNGGMVHLEEHGGVENCSGVQRAGDGYCFAEGEVTKLYDPAFDAFYEAGTDLGLWHITTIGSGATAQLLVVQISSMFLGQKPTTPDDGGFVTQTHQWQALEDGQVVDPDTDLARAPIRIAILGGA